MRSAIGSSFLILQTVSIRFKASSPSINESASAIANERYTGVICSDSQLLAAPIRRSEG